MSKNIWLNVEKVTELFKTSDSAKEIILKLDLPLNTSSYRNLKTFAEKQKLEIPKSYLKQKKKVNTLRTPNEELFVINSTASRHSIKTRALSEGFLEYKCYSSICENSSQMSMTKWDGITLQLEHKNGIGDDNRIENLELLCPNCHSMTETYGIGNRIRYENGSNKTCSECGRISKSLKCINCEPKKAKLSSVSLEVIANRISEYGIDVVSAQFDMKPAAFVDSLRKRQNRIISIIGEADSKYHPEVTYPDVEILVEKVIKQGYSKTGRELGVTDNAIRKHLIKHIGKENLPIKTKKKI